MNRFRKSLLVFGLFTAPFSVLAGTGGPSDEELFILAIIGLLYFIYEMILFFSTFRRMLKRIQSFYRHS